MLPVEQILCFTWLTRLDGGGRAAPSVFGKSIRPQRNNSGFFFPRYEQRTEWIGENKCGGVEKASWLGEVGRLWVVGGLILTTIMWLNQIPSSSPLLLCGRSEFGLGRMFRYGCRWLVCCQRWQRSSCSVLFVVDFSESLLYSVLCCESHVVLLQLEVGAPAWVASGCRGCLFPFQVSFLGCGFIMFASLI